MISIDSHSRIYKFLSRQNSIVWLKKQVDKAEYMIFRWKCCLRKVKRRFFVEKYSFHQQLTCLCIKRPDYVNFAIKNINSLHYFNPSHTWELCLDRICMKRFQQQRKFLDYPENVIAKITYPVPKMSWQYYKLKTFFDCISRNRILVDADSRWFSDLPSMLTDKVIFLTKAYPVKNSSLELDFFIRNYPKVSYKKWIHYATGFLFIPESIVTKKFINDLWNCYKRIIKESDSEIVRLQDEISINYAVNMNVSPGKISVLKEIDGPGNRNILQSYYYGCWNRIIE